MEATRTIASAEDLTPTDLALIKQGMTGTQLSVQGVLATVEPFRNFNITVERGGSKWADFIDAIHIRLLGTASVTSN